MGSFSDDDEEYRFFDAQENIASVSNSVSECREGPDSSSFMYNLWIRSPASVEERRNKFFRWMGIGLEDRILVDNSVDPDGGVLNGGFDRIMKTSGAVLRSPVFEDEFSSSRSSVSSWSGDTSDLSRGSGSTENFVCRFGNTDGGPGCNVDGLRRDGELKKLKVGWKDQLVTAEECEDTPGSYNAVHQVVQSEIEVAVSSESVVHRVKKRWLNRLRSMSCIVDRQGKADDTGRSGFDAIRRARIQRVRARHCKKRLKELSALFIGQDIQAHEGSILTMKFSPDGQYLASAGEDRIVRVWQVVEDERANEIDIPDVDPSCIYFTVNHLSELAPLMTEKERISKLKSLKKTAESACVVFPPKVFRLMEKPLHEFHGHNGEILDLSWSNKNVSPSNLYWIGVFLGVVECLFSKFCSWCSVFFRLQLIKMFVCGELDVTIASKSFHTVIMGGIIGSMKGSCRFFTVSGNTSFFPQDPSKVMVTCADSLVRILHGTDVIGKYRGLRNAGNQISAEFTSDGKHIVSAGEDSNIYMWNCRTQEDSSLSQPKTTRSFEYFSTDASVAVPWFGLKMGNSSHVLDEISSNKLPFSSSTCFSLCQDFSLDSIPKGSATWPEENLPSSSPRGAPSAVGKSQYRFLRTSCQSASNSHAWGLVIVTAGWDGRIRSFHNYGLPVPL
ncbi:hypothetical protein RJ639_032688 [Escallonia herrerae]|uniref:WD repeat-containing protein 44 n=1 Tax=Escallonia herrerae TaxID=1293975 RepID=A0AA88X2I7_9ASTE|nr:hypothetical protein RJ639_032688 [Escallonia herrerae]